MAAIPTRERRNRWTASAIEILVARASAHGRSRSRDRRVAETLVDTAYWGARCQACRSRPRFFGSIQCSMGFRNDPRFKNSRARTPQRVSQPTPDSEPRITSGAT